jgi:hypothetical protein
VHGHFSASVRRGLRGICGEKTRESWRGACLREANEGKAWRKACREVEDLQASWESSEQRWS